mgnify:CR=1 FL=1
MGTDVLFANMAGGMLLRQIAVLNIDDGDQCLRLFKSNHHVGIVIFVSRAQPTSRGRLLYGALFGLFLLFIGLGAWLMSLGRENGTAAPAAAGATQDDNSASMG